MQSDEDSKWAMSGDGTVLANWSGGEDEVYTIKLYDCSLQGIFSFVEESEAGIVYSASWRSFVNKISDHTIGQVGAPALQRLMHSAAINDLIVLLSECHDYVLDLAWMHEGPGVLALGTEFLFHSAQPVCAWQPKPLDDIQGCQCHSGTFSRASWCPDNTSVLLLGLHGVLIWSSKSDTVVAQFCGCLVPQYPFASHTSCQLVKCSPDFPGMLAVLDYQHLGLLNVRMRQVQHTISFPTCEQPRSLSCNKLGSQLTLSRGNAWYVVCFGAAVCMLQPAERMADLLLEVRDQASTEPSQDDFPLSRHSAQLHQSLEHLGKPWASSSCCVEPSLSLDLLAQNDMHDYFSSTAS